MTTTKAANYIEQLDNARCRGDWAAVPELVRKVRKHAPQRECLTLTAETECAISNSTTGAERPSISAIVEKLNVDVTIPKLQAAIEGENEHRQDAFQARVCVGWMYWVVTEYDLALDHLPNGLAEAGQDARDSLTEWTSVCALKSAYLRANCLMRDSQRQPALAAFQSGLPSLDRVWGGQPVHSQLKYWSELYLTEYCMLNSESIRQGDATFDQQNSISCFRAWARYWEAMSAPVTGGFGFKGSVTSVPRRTIWSEYYQGLSKHLFNDDAFPAANLGNTSADTPVRTQLRMELKRVEASYEKLLLFETEFPRADEHRSEVENFIKQVMDNWAILCGRGWSEKDLGQGGRAGISRGVLETLYNAATKTYHSTLILRSLFKVHISIAEFDLAFKALDSYLELVNKGKARIAKTGIPEPSLDSDATVLETMAQAIMTLCLYGHHKSAEKARQLGAELEDWLARLAQNQPGSETASYVPPNIISLAWQAIGLSHAHWSRSTYEAASRSEIQSKAIRCLRKSLSSEYGRSKDTRSIFALGVLLAERKELSTAVEIIRSTLMSAKRDESNVADELHSGPYWQERSLVPMWHLLALLLSARQDYVMASRACDGAVEQFKDPSILFGKMESFKSEHLNDAEAKSISTEVQGGLVDEMDDFEKEELLEVKMTQLALVELQDGPNAAVNASYELLSLFTRLFGNVSTQPALHPYSDGSNTPSGRSSMRGSIFSSKEKSRTLSRQSDDGSADRGTALPVRPPTSQTVAPSIHVTDDTPRPPTSRRTSIGPTDSPRRNSLKKRNRSQSRGKSSTNGAVSHHLDGEPFFTPNSDGSTSDLPSSPTKGPPVAMSFLAREKTVSSINSHGSIISKGTEFSDLSLELTHVPSHLLPLVQFSREKERSRRTAILIKVWTMIAGFYRRANMLHECKAAIAEAQKLVQGLETEATRDPAANGAAKSAVWAEKKSIEALWGDVFSELGSLSLARGSPFEARVEFENALTHCPDHPAATIGLSNILLDIYSEKLLPEPAIPALENNEVASDPASVAVYEHNLKAASTAAAHSLPSLALGLGPAVSIENEPILALGAKPTAVFNRAKDSGDNLPAPYKTTSLPLSDRLAARDRAYTLLSGLTRLGTAWDSSEAWFALARAYEESGQPDKAKEVLWWCVELEEASGVRSWRNVAAGGYIA